MPKYNHRHSKEKKVLSKKRSLLFVIIFIILIVIIVLTFLFKLLTLKKFIFINKSKEGNAEIIVYDPDRTIPNKFVIPSDTMVESSHGLGEYKIGSLWILANKEGQKGSLVAETISKKYLVPVYLWKDDNDTNMDFWKNLKSMMLLSSNLFQTEIIDTDKLSDSILVNFVDPILNEDSEAIKIEDMTGSNRIAESITKILQISGVKILSYTKGGDDDNLDCQIIGKNKKFIYFFTKMFDCKVENSEDSQNQTTLRFGGKFVDRF